MSDEPTTLIDIYEAAGAKVSEDRQSVELKPGQMKPFEIILRVYPTTVDMDGAGNTDITFGVLLDDRYTFKDTPVGTAVIPQYFDVDIKLPVEQVMIHRPAE